MVNKRLLKRFKKIQNQNSSITNAHIRRAIHWLPHAKVKEKPELYLLWDESQWRQKCRFAQDQYNKYIIEIMPKKMKERTNTFYRCKYCGGGCNVDLKQTRSADEPMTRIINCTKCGKQYREY